MQYKTRRIFPLKQIAKVWVSAFAAMSITGCGTHLFMSPKKFGNGEGGASADAQTAQADPRVPTSIIPMNCKVQKNDITYATGVYQTLLLRSPSAAEIKEIKDAGELDREQFVIDKLASMEASNGITKFLSNLLGLGNISYDADIDEDDIAEIQKDAAIVSDLKKEAPELVLRNLAKPWPWFFTTKDIYCTKNTAPLYNSSEQESGAFVSCRLPDNRSGLLGLASVLRANASTMISENNNYHRVAFAIYLSQGYKLLSATNGPEGEEGGIPYPNCAPATDMRVSAAGLIYGSAAVPLAGSTCASCHSEINGPLSVAFRHFNRKGETYTIEAIDQLDNTDVQELGTSKDMLKTLLNESSSCWSPDGISAPKQFAGVPGLGRIIAENADLGTALGAQIPRDLGNVVPNANMSSTIKHYYEKEGETLTAAIKGFLISDAFQCQVEGENEE